MTHFENVFQVLQKSWKIFWKKNCLFKCFFYESRIGGAFLGKNREILEKKSGGHENFLEETIKKYFLGKSWKTPEQIF